MARYISILQIVFLSTVLRERGLAAKRLLRREAAIDECLPGCRCDSRTINCTSADLTKIPVPNFDYNGYADVLILNNNKIKSISREEMKNWSFIERLFIRQNEIEELGPRAFADLRFISELDLSQNRLKSIDKPLFAEDTRLSKLALSQNAALTIGDDSFDNVARLRELDISRCAQDRLSYDMIGGKSLRRLFAKGNRIRTIANGLKSTIRALTALDLNQNPFHCNCELKWLRKLLKNEEQRITDRPSAVEKVVCATPETVKETSLTMVDEDLLLCERPTVERFQLIGMNGENQTAETLCTASGDPYPTVEVILKNTTLAGVTKGETKTQLLGVEEKNDMSGVAARFLIDFSGTTEDKDIRFQLARGSSVLNPPPRRFDRRPALRQNVIIRDLRPVFPADSTQQLTTASQRLSRQARVNIQKGEARELQQRDFQAPETSLDKIRNEKTAFSLTGSEMNDQKSLVFECRATSLYGTHSVVISVPLPERKKLQTKKESRDTMGEGAMLEFRPNENNVTRKPSRKNSPSQGIQVVAGVQSDSPRDLASSQYLANKLGDSSSQQQSKIYGQQLSNQGGGIFSTPMTTEMISAVIICTILVTAVIAIGLGFVFKDLCRPSSTDRGGIGRIDRQREREKMASRLTLNQSNRSLHRADSFHRSIRSLRHNGCLESPVVAMETTDGDGYSHLSGGGRRRSSELTPLHCQSVPNVVVPRPSAVYLDPAGSPDALATRTTALLSASLANVDPYDVDEMVAMATTATARGYHDDGQREMRQDMRR